MINRCFYVSFYSIYTDDVSFVVGKDWVLCDLHYILWKFKLVHEVNLFLACSEVLI